MKNYIPGKIILVHKGALGDFLLSWPAILSIRKAFPAIPIFWAGRPKYSIWLEPLGIQMLPRTMERHVNLLYHDLKWPRILDDALIFWFGIDRVTTSCVDHRLIFLKGVDKDISAGFTETCLAALMHNGVIPVNDWSSAWNMYFGPLEHPEHVLIIPGSGSKKKNWPLDNYLLLAELLEKRNVYLKFVLGPAELEQGMNVPGFESTTCQNYVCLQELIKKSSLVIGNDSGPMHLAGMFRVPGVALFGSSCPKIWKPFGIKVLTGSRFCHHCSTPARTNCPEPDCINEIRVDQVFSLVSAMT